MNPLHISTQFDSGAIEVVSLDDHRNIQLNIRKDNAADFAQWFHFSLHGAAGLPIVLKFLNAGDCAYPKGWEGYQVVASVDRQHWFRIDTQFDGQVMTARMTPDRQCVYFAYFEPYSYEQHLDLLSSAGMSPLVTLERLGSTVEGRDMTLMRVTDAHSATPLAQKKKVWLIARQHPGETMAEWFAEGFLERLLDPHDAVSRVLLDRCMFYVVPHMNPDGAVRGNLRTNAAGANLNREWAEPSMERSPEVFLVRQKMLQTGVDLCLDAHGDEGLPYNFVAGSEGTQGYSPRLADLENSFKNHWLATCPDFQDEYNYGICAPGQANPTLATNWIAQQFGCLALTIEMPFKDNAYLPDPAVGWNGERSKKLGASVLQPLLALL
ncbi:MAG: M14-type cytosolic carboxypeptidase [Rhodoferax sp.]|nr:M14-type cytosolic carboxypeptidase [Rhodoferax sp.]MDP3651781.1 M14-type cytosolic carboxypeptidase [Rhodoferax sp.]